jgi:tripartite-type tricarboxylate transporter receptor subunit TctC
MKRLSFIGGTAFIAILFASLSMLTDAQAQAFPSKVVKLVIPYPPGGNTDAIARPVTQRLSEIWGQPVIIENRPGAGTTIGAEYVAKAAPDGYTLLFSDIATYVVSPHLFSKLNYNALTDFAPITIVFRLSPVLGLSNAVPAKDFGEFLAYGKANPGKLSYASFGNGSYPHVAIEQLKQMTGMDLVHVPYKGGAAAFADLIGGRVAIIMANYSIIEPHEKAGKLKIIGAVTETRLAVRPDLPTISESGVPGYSVSAWAGMVAPAGTPASVLDKIRADIVKILHDPDFNERFLKPQALEPLGNSREEFATMLKAEYAHWGRLVSATGAKID